MHDGVTERHEAKLKRRYRARRIGAGKLTIAGLLTCGLVLWFSGEDVGEHLARLASCRDLSTASGPDRDCSDAPAASTGRSSPSVSVDPLASSATGLVRGTSVDASLTASDQSTFSDLASATFRPRAVTRERYLTVSERCDLGLGDARLRCGVGVSLGGPTSARGADDPSPGLSISGRVITAEGYGIPGVTLIASRIGAVADTGESDSSQVRTARYTRYRAVSGADGSYQFADIPDGDYTIRNNKHDDYGSVRITVRAGVQYADLVLEEERRFVIEGRVTDEYGLALGQVAVLPLVVGAPSVRTDRSGWYALPVSITPGAGSVTLRFEAPGFRETSLTARLPRRSNADDSASEARIALDAKLQSIELTTNVRGTVVGAGKEPIAGRVVELIAVDGHSRHQAVTDRAGHYEFPIIAAPLRYELRVGGAPDFADYREVIGVSRYDYEFDVVMEPYEFGTLRGRFINSDGTPIPGIELGLRNTASAGNNASLKSDALGNFVVEHVPAGTAVLNSAAMPSFHVRGLTVEPASESNVDVVLDWGTHELSGRVVDRYGRALPGSSVVVRWSHEADGIKSTATRRAATDAQGHFRFFELGPGPHSLVVDAPGFATATFDHDMSQDGYSVTVRVN
jgi:hypothetical protein